MASARSRSAGPSPERTGAEASPRCWAATPSTEVSGRGLRSIVAYTREDNVASRGVMSKLGMTYEKSFDDDGEAHVLYRLQLDRD